MTYLEDHPTDRNWLVTGAIYTWITHELGIILDKVTKWDDPSKSQSWHVTRHVSIAFTNRHGHPQN